MDYLENRELSWLKFNKRVLEEVTDENVPLLERLSFSAIYQSNLDEFFMVRVGTLIDDNDDQNTKNKRENKTKMTPAEQLDAVFTTVRRLQILAEDSFFKTVELLKPYGYEQVNFDCITDEERNFLELYFKREIKPLLSPIVIDKSRPFPFFNNKELYIAVQLKEKDKDKKGITIGIIPVKNEHFSRMIPLNESGSRFILAEDVILHFAHLVFKNYKIIDRVVIRVTRNADIDPDNEGDFRENMEKLVSKRKKLAPVRLELSDNFSGNALDYLCKKLKLKNQNVFYSRIPLDLSYLFSVSDLFDDNTLKYPKMESQKPVSLAENRSIISQVRSKDILLSYPYESMNTFIKLLNESATDPKVTSIKITLYRLARNSKIIDALCTAAESGKEVIVLVELRARFDEENNINWSKVLQNAGCRVIYGPRNYKVHSKLLLITYKSRNGIEHITQIGTGNYNEKTSKLYTDLALITSNPEIASDAEEVFNRLLKKEFVEDTKRLLVAPLCLQNRILEKMDRQIELAKNGKSGYIGAKINSLSDRRIIDKLIEASQAGVKIDLVVRGICCIIAGVEGFTENITVRSIVGRFLEHSRIYIFGKDEDSEIYISSADYMTRNTVKRVEVAVPILDEKIKNRIFDMFNIMLADNVKARIQCSNGIYVRAEKSENEEPINAQEYFCKEAYRKTNEKKMRQERLKKNKKSET
ncbi:MAG: polyphosphate kinase 1 [Oscillospiraceae bacterium]|nr:polyphosphate kinase 1 [Oscillospiraceae bacterium]